MKPILFSIALLIYIAQVARAQDIIILENFGTLFDGGSFGFEIVEPDEKRTAVYFDYGIDTEEKGRLYVGSLHEKDAEKPVEIQSDLESELINKLDAAIAAIFSEAEVKQILEKALHRKTVGKLGHYAALVLELNAYKSRWHHAKQDSE